MSVDVDQLREWLEKKAALAEQNWYGQIGRESHREAQAEAARYRACADALPVSLETGDGEAVVEAVRRAQADDQGKPLTGGLRPSCRCEHHKLGASPAPEVNTEERK